MLDDLIDAVARELTAAAPSPSFSTRVASRIAQEREHAGPVRARAAWTTAFGATTAAVLILVFAEWRNISHVEPHFNDRRDIVLPVAAENGGGTGRSEIRPNPDERRLAPQKIRLTADRPHFLRGTEAIDAPDGFELLTPQPLDVDPIVVENLGAAEPIAIRPIPIEAIDVGDLPPR